MPIEKRWEIADPISPEADRALQGYHPVLRQILYNREITDPGRVERFLSARPESDTDPFLLSGMGKAVDRIREALEKDEKIVVYGDYDADGVTATALLTQALQALDARVEPYIPNRFDEGYGLNNGALKEIRGLGTGLVITVDCGIRAIEQAVYARELGLDLVITDHHNPGPALPEALAIINPKQPGDAYPAANLAGVGVAYKLAHALVQVLEPDGFERESLLDLVALGTVADLVPLTGENRALVRSGLQRLRHPQRQGLFSLMQLAGIRPAQIRASNIGFGLGPRLNAAGRLDTALAAYELLTTRDVMRAGQLAQQLDNQNRERQRITREMQALAEEIAIRDGRVPYLLFAAHESFNPGVVGLAASRLTEHYYRPSIVGQREGETTRASCRSIPEFDITAALDACADLLLHYGGHAAAAGFTVSNDKLPELIRRLQDKAARELEGFDLRPVIRVDAEVPLHLLTMDLLQILEGLQPTGQGNPEPVFVSRGLRVVKSRTVGRDGAHLKLALSDGSRTLDAIAFRQGEWQRRMPEALDVVYNFEKNEYQGYVSPQLNVRDLKAADSTSF